MQQDILAARAAAMQDLRTAFAALVALTISEPVTDHRSEGPFVAGLAETVPLIAALDTQVEVQREMIEAGTNEPYAVLEFVQREGQRLSTDAVDAIRTEIAARLDGQHDPAHPLARMMEV